MKTKATLFLLSLAFSAFLAPKSSISQTTVNFNCTGSSQNWTVPPCVTSINVTVAGAEGGGGLGGNGAVLTATIPVTPGQVIGMSVGCSGTTTGGSTSGGFGGGGDGFASTDGNASYNSSGGGGASTLSIGGSAYMIAAGGGGEGGGSGIVGGGAGGCATGVTGTSTFGGGATGGTQTAGGTGGIGWISTPPGGSNGGLGFGGMGGFWQTASGGGGGGGYYGGGGGGNDGCCTGANGGGGGGGGSSLVPAGAGCTQGSNNGPGYITVTYSSGALTPTVNSPTICAGQSATLTATGGTTYSWNTGSTANPLTVSPATTTSYTVTAASSACTGTAVATVTVNPSPVTTVNSSTVCAGTTATLTAGGATTYSWNTGSTANPLSVTPGTTTTYTVTGTSLGCTSSAVSTVTVTPMPVTTVNSPTICASSSATLTAAGATTYLWSTGSTANPLSVSPATTTSYTVTGTTSGCTSSAVSTVTTIPTLAVNAGLSDTVCFGGSTVLNVTPNGAGYTYSWTPTASLTGAATFNPTASPATTTTYSVMVTDPNGCTGTSTVTIYADPQITMAIAGIDATCNGACNGQTIVIPAGGTSAYSYNWTGGCAAASCNSLCPGTYTVIVTDAWGCTASASTTVAEPTLLTASVTSSAPVTCNAACDGTATAAGNGGTVGGGYAYSWNTVPVQNTDAATGLCAGTYVCTITDANSCTATTTVTITQPTAVVIAPIVSPSICMGGSTTLTASASGGNPGGYNYVWTPVGTGSTASVTVSPTVTTVYTVNATDIANNCPAAPVTVTVTVSSALSVVANGTASICPGASTSISAVAANGNGGPYTYTWAPAGSGSPLSVSPAATTTYTVTASDGCSPTVTATVTVTVLPMPVVSFTSSATSGCEPLCVTFTNNSVVPAGVATTWSFNYGDGTANDTAHYHCYNNDGVYSVGLTVTSGGCTSSFTNTNMITVHPMPVADFTAPQNTSIINPVVNFNDNSTNAASWYWNFGDFYAGADSVSNLQNPSHEYTETGTFCVTLSVVSPFGCMDAIQQCIVIDPEFSLYIPNGFSPNGDGINDEFYCKGDFIKKYEMTIYDRWGNLIFLSDDINKHWDGKANHGDEIAQQDVYVYAVKITDNKDKKHKYIGTVTIVK